MAEISITINGRKFGISCDDGQEQRVIALANFVDNRLQDISKSGAGTNESHLLVLTSLVMADEMFDLREGVASSDNAPLGGLHITEADEGAIISALDQMASRIDTLAGSLQNL